MPRGVQITDTLGTLIWLPALLVTESLIMWIITIFTTFLESWHFNGLGFFLDKGWLYTQRQTARQPYTWNKTLTLAVREMRMFSTLLNSSFFNNVHYGPLHWCNDPLLCCSSHQVSSLSDADLPRVPQLEWWKGLTSHPVRTLPVQCFPLVPWVFCKATENLFCRSSRPSVRMIRCLQQKNILLMFICNATWIFFSCLAVADSSVA